LRGSRGVKLITITYKINRKIIRLSKVIVLFNHIVKQPKVLCFVNRSYGSIEFFSDLFEIGPAVLC
jgi:hypothetical protein